MGCDIHFYVERRTKDGWEYVEPPKGFDVEHEKWLGYAKAHGYAHGPPSFYSDRNYRLFGILAGVRDPTVDPIAPPREVPDDMSITVRKAHDPRYHHSHSWLTLAEILGHDWEQRPPCRYDPEVDESLAEQVGDFYTKTLPALKKLGDPADVRVVFWFDS